MASTMMGSGTTVLEAAASPRFPFLACPEWRGRAPQKVEVA